ncbi:FAD/NAD-binding domain-containing protein [Leucogyrophana mollusca]|uniref:FAD/NAD-binding domain-containing protein n=1 Tax=Leucogyrophana mollusca TaxID=85980 RepID=A0ACB8BHA5_9AGAM|nr:FAD/NAD-binding domain-containing protein [Leucogyrophana mollusca]
MTSWTSRLPTLDSLKAVIPADLDVKSVASEWLLRFATALGSENLDAVLGLFVDDALWRDMLAFTWDFRTFDSTPEIRRLLADRLPVVHPTCFKLRDLVQLQKPYPDLAWIVAMFDFESDIGVASGVVRLVPTSDGTWKAHTIFTNLEDLKGFPERVGPSRSRRCVSGTQWAEERRQDAQFETSDPVVLVVGGGHCALQLAARLKYLDVPTLVVERNARLGDTWRQRYDALCLHWPVWYDHMPYIPFPPTWPLYTPSLKLADWIESYAHSLELDVWTSATVVHAAEVVGKGWNVTVKRDGAAERTLFVRHLAVFANGQGDGLPDIPKYVGLNAFKGTILHSSKYRNAKAYQEKKVVVVGCGNSGHDTAADLARHGVDVTMFQRSPTYVMNLDKGWKFIGGPLYSEGSVHHDIADRLAASCPHLLQIGGLAQRAVRDIAINDRELLDGLNKVGFKTYLGDKDAGIVGLLKTRGGGHYFDVGASQLIMDGKIKIKNDSQIQCFTEAGLKFENGSELPADTVIFATGSGDMRNGIRAVCGDKVADRCKPIWGLDEEGELRGVSRDLGVPGLWFITGSLSMSRFHTKHLALQIKAQVENVFGSRYSIEASRGHGLELEEEGKSCYVA